jgi:two-component system response regulator FixJ
MDQAVSLFLVDDEPDVTRSLSWLLETAGLTATTFNSPRDFLEFFSTCVEPCTITLDLRMPGITGIDVLERVRRARPDVAVVFLTGHGDVPSAVQAMKLGAFDFLVKPFNPQAFLECVNRASQRAAEAHQIIRRKRENQNALSRLSSREHQIFDHVVIGLSSKEIGRLLNISPKTVDVHRATIMKKLRVSTARELMQRFQAQAFDIPEETSERRSLV